MFIDTTKTVNGNGTFESPYNQMPVILTGVTEIFITSTSILGPIILNDTASKGLSIYGYDPTLNEEPWTTTDEILPNLGPIISAHRTNKYCIDVTVLEDEATDTILTVNNLQLVNWLESPISNTTDRIIIQNVDTKLEEFSLGWKHVHITVK